MSQSQFPGFGEDLSAFDEDEFRAEIRDTFASYEKSAQALDAEGVPLADRSVNERRRHYDGAAMPRHFEMRPFWRVVEDTARKAQYDDEDRYFTDYPSAFMHLVTHLTEYELNQLRAPDGPEDGFFERMPDHREKLLRWYLEDVEERLKWKRPGGTECVFYGEQGSTKTTAMLYVAVLLQHLTNEDNLWMASGDATEWLAMAPYTTVCLPAGVEYEVRAVSDHPDAPEYIEIPIDYVCRDTLRFTDPKDLLRQISRRTPGQFYAIYPDPAFRGCEAITGHSYHPLTEVDSVKEMTDPHHYFFPVFEQLVHGQEHTRFASVFADELHKFMNAGASKDDHDTWTKVADWGATHGDARKHHVSAFFGTHRWAEIHPRAKAKLRWVCTMNGEDFPSEAPISGDTKDQYLGQGTFWNGKQWAPLEWPNMKAVYASDADIRIKFPEWEALKQEKSSQ